jgi:hypothetical protein
MNKKYCDLCGKKIEDRPWAFKLYKGILSNDFFNINEICDDCAYKIKKFTEKL